MNLLFGAGMFIIAHSTELAGIILPAVVDYLNKDVPDEQERHIVAVLVCIGTAVLFKWNSLIYGSPQDFAAYLTIVYFESSNVYRLYFKNSPLRQNLKELYAEDRP